MTGKTIPANRAVEAIFRFFRLEVTAKSGRSAPSGFSGLCGRTRAEVLLAIQPYGLRIFTTA
jgi:hypothetical protein